MKYFRIKNWEKYQHRDASRRKGPMLFIRLNVSLLNDEKMFNLNAHDRLTWVLLLLKSGQTRNQLAWDSAWIKHELRLKWEPNLALFKKLGLIEVFYASNSAAELTPREEKRRKDLDFAAIDTITRKSFSEKKQIALEKKRILEEQEAEKNCLAGAHLKGSLGN